jgi:hypothetical protein
MDGKEQRDEGNPGKDFHIPGGKDEKEEKTGEASQKKSFHFRRHPPCIFRRFW